MAEQAAVARIVRSGGEAARTLASLNRESQDALRYLERVNPEVAKASRQWEALHEQIRRGEQLPADVMRRYDEMGAAISKRAQEAARALPGRPLTVAERSAQEQRGRYSAAELDRALVTPSGATMVPKVGAYGAVPPSLRPSSLPEPPRQSTPSAPTDERRLERLRSEHDQMMRSIESTVARQPAGNREKYREALMGSPTMQQLRDEIAQLEATQRAPASAGGLSPEEIAHYKRRGYSDEDLAGARRMGKDGPLLIQRPRSPRAPQSATPGSPAGSELPPAPRGTAVPPAPHSGAGKAVDETDAVERQTRAYKGNREEKNLGLLNERQLAQEWRRTRQDLSQQEREIDRLTEQRKKIRERKLDDPRLDEMTGRLADLKHGRAALLEHQQSVLQAANAKGMPLVGGALQPSGAITGRQMLTSFAGGAGFGGGGVPGLLGGLATGLPIPLALAAGVGLAVGAAWQFASRSMENAEEKQKRIFETGMHLGGGFSALRANATRSLTGPLMLQFDETLGATMAFASQTGRTDVGGITAFARAYGLPVAQTAALFGQMASLGRAPRRETSRVPIVAGRDDVVADAMAAMPSMPRTPYLFTEQLGASVSVREAREKMIGEYILRGTMPSGGTAPRQRRMMTVNRGRDLAEIVSGAYGSSAYASLPADRRSSLAGAFLQQVSQLLQVQAAGGAPIDDFGRAPAMLAAATRYFGPDVNPRFAAQVTGGLMQTITQPPGEMARGMALRSVMQMASRMSPGELAKFKKDTGFDPTSLTGAMATMQNAFSLPGGHSATVVRGIMGGYRDVLGKGSELEKMFFMNSTNDQAAPAIAMSELADKLVSAQPGSQTEQEMTDQFRKLMEEAGPEGQLFTNAAKMDALMSDLGEPLSKLGQGIKGAVIDFIDTLRGAQTEWEASAPNGMSTP